MGAERVAVGAQARGAGLWAVRRPRAEPFRCARGGDGSCAQVAGRRRDGGRGPRPPQRGEHAHHERQVKSRLSCSVWRSTGRGPQRVFSSLPTRLLAAGLKRRPADALLVAEIADLTLDVPPPPGVELRGDRSARAGARVVDGGVGLPRAGRRHREASTSPKNSTGSVALTRCRIDCLSLTPMSR